MTDAGYIAAGYVVTAATVASYAWSIRTRLRRVTRLATSGWAVHGSDPGHVDGRDREG